MPSPVLLAAPYCPSCQNLTNQRKPETIANVNKHMKQAVFSRESRIIAFGFEFEFELDFELDFELKFELKSELHYYKNTKSKIFRYFLTTIKIKKQNTSLFSSSTKLPKTREVTLSARK